MRGIGGVAGEGGVVGALAFRAEGLGEGDLAVRVGGPGDVVVADVVEIVVDGDGFAGQRGGAALKGGGEGDWFADGGGGGGRGERGGGGLACCC